MAPPRYTAPTRSPAWLTSFWSTSSAGLRLGAVTRTPTWEHLTTWVSGRHGSKQGPETIRVRLWSLQISGSVPAASLAVIETCRLMRSTPPGEEKTLAPPLDLAAFFLKDPLRQPSRSYRGFFSALAVHHYPA